MAKKDVENFKQNKIKNNQSSYLINKNININKKKKSINKNNNNKSFNKKTFKNKRRLSANPKRGSIGLSTLERESKKFIQTLNNFNRTYLIGDFLKIRVNWEKEEKKIKKYLINSRRSIELSVLKLASIITEDKINSLEEIVYFKYNQISSHVNLFMNSILPQIDNYIYLIENSSKILDKTFNEANQKILFDFYELKELITSQIRAINSVNKNETFDGNEKLLDLFKNKDIYQPIGINIVNNNDSKINLTKSKTVSKYRIILKYSKYCVFNDTNKKYEVIKNILEKAKILIKNIRRLQEASPTPQNQGQNNNQNNNQILF